MLLSKGPAAYRHSLLMDYRGAAARMQGQACRALRGLREGRLMAGEFPIIMVVDENASRISCGLVTRSR
ncbi:MAG TPA: hypothetical protein DCM87_19170 [Planctomycetes bacterium]|jgi:hypothetical protein|nr:hypothetical protein [Planctomycetota bacterium]